MNSSTRERIAQAAFALFRKNGFDNVTMQDISRAAGLSRKTLYTYYRSKEDIVAHCYARLAEESPRDLMLSMATMNTYRDKLSFLYGSVADNMRKFGPDIAKSIICSYLSGKRLFGLCHSEDDQAPGQASAQMAGQTAERTAGHTSAHPSAQTYGQTFSQSSAHPSAQTFSQSSAHPSAHTYGQMSGRMFEKTDGKTGGQPADPYTDRFFIELIRLGQEKGEIRKDQPPELLHRAFVCALSGALMHWVASGGKREQSDILQQMFRVVFDCPSGS